MAKKCIDYENRFKNLQEVIERIKEAFPGIEFKKNSGMANADDILVSESFSPGGKRKSVGVSFALDRSGVMPCFILRFSSPIKKSDINSQGEVKPRAKAYREGNQIVTEVRLLEDKLRKLKNLIDSQLEWFDLFAGVIGKSK